MQPGAAKLRGAVVTSDLQDSAAPEAGAVGKAKKNRTEAEKAEWAKKRAEKKAQAEEEPGADDGAAGKAGAETEAQKPGGATTGAPVKERTDAEKAEWAKRRAEKKAQGDEEAGADGGAAAKTGVNQDGADVATQKPGAAKTRAGAKERTEAQQRDWAKKRGKKKGRADEEAGAGDGTVAEVGAGSQTVQEPWAAPHPELMTWWPLSILVAALGVLLVRRQPWIRGLLLMFSLVWMVLIASYVGTYLLSEHPRDIEVVERLGYLYFGQLLLIAYLPWTSIRRFGKPKLTPTHQRVPQKMPGLDVEQA